MSKLCTVVVSPVLCLQPSVPCVACIVSSHCQCSMTCKLVLYCVFALLPAQCAVHASSVLCLHYCQHSVLCA